MKMDPVVVKHLQSRLKCVKVSNVTEARNPAFSYLGVEPKRECAKGFIK